MDQRYLNFNNFIKQRAQQITKFTQILSNSTNKRTHQSLPKSVRRRAMSHNRYRIPLKLRKPLQADLIKAQSMQRVPKCRKNIRKKHRLMISYKLRNNKIKWLNTHLWAAKRMRMQNYSGYKIAQCPNNKSFRSSYRYFRNGCCMVDYSYMQCLSIRMKKQIISQNDAQGNIKNRSVIFPQFIKIKYLKNINYNQFYQAQLYTPSSSSSCSSPSQLICPILIFIASPKQIKCIFDPFCLEQIKQINLTDHPQIQSIQISKNKSQIYLLLGPQSLNRVNQMFVKLGINKDEGVEEIRNMGMGMGMGENYRVVYVGCEKQKQDIQQQNKPNKLHKTQNKPLISQPITQKITTQYNPNQNKKIRQQFYKSFNHHKSLIQQSKTKQYKQKQKQKASKFWQFYTNLQKQLSKQSQEYKQYMWKITNRSKYTHKRMNKLSKEEKKKVLEQDAENREKGEKGEKGQKSAKKQQKKVQQSQMDIQQPIQQKQEQKQQKPLQIQKSLNIPSHTINYPSSSPSIDPTLICPFINHSSKNSLFKGCLILTSNRSNCLLWRTLTHLNIKVIGRSQYRNCIFQSSLKFYPNDYPQSISFSRYNKTRAMQLIDRHRRLPKQKRCNYVKVQSPYPFYMYIPPLIHNNHNSIYSVKVCMLSKGTCTTGSYICKLQPQDYNKIIQQMDNNNGVVNSIISQQLPSQVTHTNNNTNNLSLSSSSSSSQQIDYNTQTYQQIVSNLSNIKLKMCRQLIGFITHGNYVQSQSKEGGFGYVYDHDIFSSNIENSNGSGSGESVYALIRKPSSRYYFVGVISKL